MPFGAYRISRNPGVGVFSGHDIVRSLGAHLFESALTKFILNELQHPAPLPHLLDYHYPLYKGFTRTLPSLRGIQNDNFQDRVHASPGTSKLPARYDTVLFVENRDLAADVGVHGA